MWLLGFEPRSPRPQRGILTTKLQPQGCRLRFPFIFWTRVQTCHMLYTPSSKERERRWRWRSQQQQLCLRCTQQLRWSLLSLLTAGKGAISMSSHAGLRPRGDRLLSRCLFFFFPGGFPFHFPFLGLPSSFFRWLCCYSLISSCHQVVQVFFFSLMLLIQFITLLLLLLLLLCSSSRFQYWGSRLCLGRMLLCQVMERNYITLVL